MSCCYDAPRSSLPCGKVAEQAANAVTALLENGGVSCLLYFRFDGLQDAQMLLLELLEAIVKLLVPWVQDTHLEAECRASDDKVGDGEGASDDHGD